MNSIKLHSVAGRSFGLLLSLVLAGSAYAGPGPQYWQSLGDTSTRMTASAKSESTATKSCAGSSLVGVTVTKSTWSNGRGPLQTVETNALSECNSCASTFTAMKASWASNRGPLTRVQVVSEHVCGSSCSQPAHT
jgi:hypothetical protein